MDEIMQQRKNGIKHTIDSNPDLKKLIEDNESYVSDLKNLNLTELIEEIQPRWSDQRFLNEEEGKKLTLLLIEYQMRGLDMDYFLCGSGSYIKSTSTESSCNIL
jgi:hypothetical protein